MDHDDLGASLALSGSDWCADLTAYDQFTSATFYFSTGRFLDCVSALAAVRWVEHCVRLTVVVVHTNLKTVGFSAEAARDELGANDVGCTLASDRVSSVWQRSGIWDHGRVWRSIGVRFLGSIEPSVSIGLSVSIDSILEAVRAPNRDSHRHVERALFA